MKYIIESFYEDAKVTVETNDAEVAVLEIILNDERGVHAHCVDGETGEILIIVNSPDGRCPYVTQQFASMALYTLMAQLWS
jgi:hypothetical protein